MFFLSEFGRAIDVTDEGKFCDRSMHGWSTKSSETGKESAEKGRRFLDCVGGVPG